MFGTKELRDMPRIRGFVEFFLFESDRAGRDRPLHEMAHSTHDRRGIDAAAQEGTQWYVTHHANACRFAQFVAEQFAPLIFCPIFYISKREVPIANFANVTVRGHQVVARSDLSRRRIDGLWSRNVAARKVVTERFAVDSAGQAVSGE